MANNAPKISSIFKPIRMPVGFAGTRNRIAFNSEDVPAFMEVRRLVAFVPAKIGCNPKFGYLLKEDASAASALARSASVSTPMVSRGASAT